MFNILPIIIIIGGLAVIAYVIVRRFPDLSVINVETIRHEKEKQVKRQLLNERLKRRTEKMTKALQLWSQKLGGSFASMVHAAQDRIARMEARTKGPTVPDMLVTKNEFASQEEGIAQDLEEAEGLLRQDEFELAEKKFINIIAADPKNAEAFEGLGDLYFERKMYPEAKETLMYVLKLNRESAMANADLAKIFFLEKDLEGALQYIQEALRREPNNPKFIDLGVQIALAEGNRSIAGTLIGRLRSVNPENNKLSEFQEQLSNLHG